MPEYILEGKFKATSDDAPFKQAEDRINALVKAQKEYWKVHDESLSSLNKTDEALQIEAAELQKVLDKIDPLGKATRSLADDQKLLAEAFKGGRLTQEQYEDATAKLSARHQKLAERLNESERSSVGLGDAFKRLLGAVVGLFALDRVIAFLREGATEAYRKERALNALVTMVHQFDPAEEAAAEKIKTFTTAMKEQGIEDGITTDTLREMIPVTGSLEDAVRATRLAFDISTATGYKYNDMAVLMRDLVAGGERSVQMAHRKLGTEAKDAQGVLDELYGKFGGWTEKLQDHQKELDKVKTKWQEIKEAAGQIPGAIADGIGSLGGFLREEIAFQGKEYESWVDRFRQTIPLFALMSKMGAKSPFGGDSKQEAEEQERLRARLIATYESQAAVAREKLATLDKESQEYADYAQVLKNATEQLAKLQKQEEAGKAPEGAPKAHALDKDPKKPKMDGTVLDLARAYEDLKAAETEEAQVAYDNAEGKRAMAQTAGVLVAALKAQHEAEKASLEVERAQKVASAQGNAAAIERINAEFTAKEEALEKRQIARLDALDQDHLKKIEAIEKKITDIKAKEEDKRFKDAQKEAEKHEALEKKREADIRHFNDRRVRAEQALYGQLTGLAAQYGGKSIQSLVSVVRAAEQLYTVWQTVSEIFYAKKKVEELTNAVSSQLTTKAADVSQGTMNAELWAINAAQSVAAIPMVGWSMAPGVFAAALAEGMAAVGAIAAVPVGGFDDPANDAMAHLGGRKWATDMIREWTSGVSRGWAEAMQTARVDRRHISTVNDQSHTDNRTMTTVNLRQNILTGGQGESAYRDLEWRLRKAKRFNDRKASGSGPVRIGKKR